MNNIRLVYRFVRSKQANFVVPLVQTGFKGLGLFGMGWRSFSDLASNAKHVLCKRHPIKQTLFRLKNQGIAAHSPGFRFVACEGMTKMRNWNRANVGHMFSRCLATSVGDDACPLPAQAQFQRTQIRRVVEELGASSTTALADDAVVDQMLEALVQDYPDLYQSTVANQGLGSNPEHKEKAVAYLKQCRNIKSKRQQQNPTEEVKRNQGRDEPLTLSDVLSVLNNETDYNGLVEAAFTPTKSFDPKLTPGDQLVDYMKATIALLKHKRGNLTVADALDGLDDKGLETLLQGDKEKGGHAHFFELMMPHVQAVLQSHRAVLLQRQRGLQRSRDILVLDIQRIVEQELTRRKIKASVRKECVALVPELINVYFEQQSAASRISNAVPADARSSVRHVIETELPDVKWTPDVDAALRRFSSALRRSRGDTTKAFETRVLGFLRGLPNASSNVARIQEILFGKQCESLLREVKKLSGDLGKLDRNVKSMEPHINNIKDWLSTPQDVELGVTVLKHLQSIAKGSDASQLEQANGKQATSLGKIHVTPLPELLEWVVGVPPVLQSVERYMKWQAWRFDSSEPNEAPTKYCAYKPLWYFYPYWGAISSLKATSKQLHDNRHSRKLIHYISSPTATGKTSCVLPSFLSTNLSVLYFYIAFDNNKLCNFKIGSLPPNVVDESSAMAYGAQWMHEVLSRYLGDGEPATISPTPTCEYSLTYSLMNAKMRYFFGNTKILLHIDEHARLTEHKLRPHLSRGAMELAGHVEQFSVVATHTRVLSSVSPQRSSSVCRYPVALPSLDPELMLDYLDPDDELQLREIRQYPNLRTQQRRQLAVFDLRFAMAVQGMYTDVHRTIRTRTGKERNNPWRKLDDLKARSNKIELTDIKQLRAYLNACIECCVVDLSSTARVDPHARAMLLGVVDDDSFFGKNMESIVTLPSGKLGYHFSEMFARGMPDDIVYAAGLKRMKHVILNSSNGWLESTPLEEAYTWVLSVDATTNGCLCFANTKEFECQIGRVEAGRIFPGTDRAVFRFGHIDPQVFYFAHEQGRVQQAIDDMSLDSHPAADMFFLTTEGTLVLIDVTGGDEHTLTGSETTSKVPKLQKVVADMNSKLHDDTVNPGRMVKAVDGVILAPCAPGGSDCIDRVTVVRGDQAIEMLGSMGQLAQWMRYASHDNHDKSHVFK
eukprot:m.349280 g.349280  ORF g.349280 m.349280 type:complete len:1174 (-) comp16150_c0_seq6:261-3782(-)